MEIALVLTVTMSIAAVAYALLKRAPAPTPLPVPTSPLDQAERILALRYARGRISAEEYDRMAAILRR